MAVGAVWGFTNALMERNSKRQSDVFANLFSNLSSFGFALAFIANQLMSVVNNFVIAGCGTDIFLMLIDVSIAVPSVNCLTFLFTFISEKWLKQESIFSWSKLIL